MLGRQPITLADGTPLTDAKGRRSYATSAGASPSTGKHVLLAYLPPEQAVEGTKLFVQYFARALPGDGRRRRRPAAVRPREPPHPGMTMKVLVCIKRVPAVAGRITLTEDARAIDVKYLGFAIGPHEECAVEQAVRFVEEHGGESVVLTLGPAEALEQLRDAMALGVNRAIHLVTDGEEWDPQATAAAITDAIRADEAESGPFDVLLFGNEAGDTGGYQVGVRVGARPRAPGGHRHQGPGGHATASLRCEQEAGAGRDVYELPMPAVAAVLEGLNLPRYPSVPGRIRAKSKPVADVQPRPARLRPGAAPARGPGRGGAGGDDPRARGPGAAGAVVELLGSLGVL